MRSCGTLLQVDVKLINQHRTFLKRIPVLPTKLHTTISTGECLAEIQLSISSTSHSISSTAIWRWELATFRPAQSLTIDSYMQDCQLGIGGEICTLSSSFKQPPVGLPGISKLITNAIPALDPASLPHFDCSRKNAEPVFSAFAPKLMIPNNKGIKVCRSIDPRHTGGITAIDIACTGESTASTTCRQPKACSRNAATITSGMATVLRHRKCPPHCHTVFLDMNFVQFTSVNSH
ncbi:unnamed protein product [Mesocestoides corti]|uniref:Uncharacterized protein n=1 Tax=Mesocestoides corti TaxID=53468 RepID=A0A0R3UAH7_MESCO|nr:unnamed protein product [Mesocestoides corti]